MDKIKFNSAGNLVPSEAIQVGLEDVRYHFVEAFPHSTTRRELFSNLDVYIAKFQSEIFPWFEIWLNGSFVTQKENPKDIDLVVFLEKQVFDLKSKSLDNFLSFNLENEGLDAFVLAVYPESHSNFINFEKVRNRCYRLFSADRDSRPKGFLEMKFQRKVS